MYTSNNVSVIFSPARKPQRAGENIGITKSPFVFHGWHGFTHPVDFGPNIICALKKLHGFQSSRRMTRFLIYGYFFWSKEFQW